MVSEEWSGCHEAEKIRFQRRIIRLASRSFARNRSWKMKYNQRRDRIELETVILAWKNIDSMSVQLKEALRRKINIQQIYSEDKIVSVLADVLEDFLKSSTLF